MNAEDDATFNALVADVEIEIDLSNYDPEAEHAMTDDDEDGYPLPADFDSWSIPQREAWAFSPLGEVTMWEERQRRHLYTEWLAEHPEADPLGRSGGGTSQRAPFTILTRADLRRMPKVGWLIDGLLQTSGLVILGGDGGVGKSSVALDWAACIATGRAWSGRAVETGNVLYVAGEGVEGIEGRLTAWESVAGVSIPDDRLGFVAEGFDLSNAAAVAQARAAVVERDYALVILDTFSQLSSVESENDNAEVARVLGQAKAIRQARPGTTVLIVHHTSKGGRLRGASALRNNADAVIIAREARTNLGGFCLSTENEVDGKQKNGRAEKIDGLWLDEVGGSPVVRMGGRDPLVQAILGLAADGQDHAAHEFYLVCVAASDAEKKAVQRTLKRLVDSGELVHNGQANRAARWGLGQS